MFLIIQISIIGNKHIIWNHSLNDRMTAFFDIKDSFFIDFRTDIVVALCNKCKRTESIQCGNCFGSLLDSLHLSGNRFTDFAVKFIFQCIQLIFCTKDHVFKLFQLRCDITFSIRKGLFSCIIIRYKILVRICHFQIITEYFVVFYFQVFNACFFSFIILKFCKPVFSVRFRPAKLINFFVITVADNISLFHGKRRILTNGFRDELAEIF